MEVSTKMRFILGIQLAVLINVSQSFVLLTANMDDVKKLARKFVSDQLAEQIAEFIAKITSSAVGTVDNVSEENERNAGFYHQISGEDGFRNKAVKPRFPQNIDPQNQPERQYRKPETKRTHDVDEKKRYQDRMAHTKKYREPKSRQGKLKRPESNFYPKNNRIPQVQTELKSNYYAKVDHAKKKEDRQDNMSEDYKEPLQELYVSKTTKRRRKPRTEYNDESSQRDNSNPRSNTGLADKYEFEENPNSARHRFVQMESEELHANRDLARNVSKTTSKHVNNNSNDKIIELTTEKVKTEFDQYDNKQYPKSEFVATSGPVALPKVHTLTRYWEKEKLEIKKSKDDDKKKKAWF